MSTKKEKRKQITNSHAMSHTQKKLLPKNKKKMYICNSSIDKRNICIKKKPFKINKVREKKLAMLRWTS